MPKVGSFTFPYTDEGMKAASRTSKMMNIPIDNGMDDNIDLYSTDTNLYSNVGNNLDSAFNTGKDNRGGPRTMSTPGLSLANFDTGSTDKQNFPWDNSELGGIYG
jgi:hypothetical protein